MSRIPDSRRHDRIPRTPRRRCPRGSRLHADRRRPRTRAPARLHARPHRTRASAARAGQRTGRHTVRAHRRIRGPYRDRGRLPERELPARRHRAAAALETSSSVGFATGLPRRPEARGDVRRRRDARHSGRPLDPGHRAPGGPRAPGADRRLADGSLLRAADRPRPRRLRAVRRRTAAPGREPRRGGAADANLAGVQPAGRRRERRPRHLVHRPRARPRPARPSVRAPRCPASLPHVRPRLPAVAPRHGPRCRRPRSGGPGRGDGCGARRRRTT